MTRLLSALRLLTVFAFAAAACSDDESPPLPPADHTPETYSIQVNDVPVSAPYTFTPGQSVRVRIRFFNQAGEDLDEVESSHFAALTFTPASLASAVRAADHNFQFDVTGGTVGTGTLEVGYGHNEAADEVVFEPEAVTVSGP